MTRCLRLLGTKALAQKWKLFWSLYGGRLHTCPWPVITLAALVQRMQLLRVAVHQNLRKAVVASQFVCMSTNK